MNEPFYTTIKEPVRRAHCKFCGGLGANDQAETVISAIGTRYRIPLSHETCKQSVLSLSLSLSLSMIPSPLPSEEEKGVVHEKSSL